MRYFLVAGETSGDIHGAQLADAIRHQDPEAQFAIVGGDRLAQATGVSPVVHSRDLALMGFVEVLLHARRVLRYQQRTRSAIRDFAPDALILIDSSGFNLPLARALRGVCPRIFYYIPPKVWAWQRGRVKSLRAFTDAVFPILPFEAPFLQQHGVAAQYLGNPLLDELPLSPDPLQAESRAKARAELTALLQAQSAREDRETSGDASPEGGQGDDGSPIVALIPGSRLQEIEHNLPLMLAVADALPSCRFAITAVPTIPETLYAKHLSRHRSRDRIGILHGATHLAMRGCDAGLVTSGTATLEAALLGLPQVVVYRGNPLTIWLGRRLVHVDHISLANLVAGHGVVQELIQEAATPSRALSALQELLPGGAGLETLRGEYQRIRELMGRPGSSARVAEAIVKLTHGA